jgi:transposase InsO family protein
VRALDGAGHLRVAGRRVGHDYVHYAIDDHTRPAYAGIHQDETAVTCAGFLRAASAWFAAEGITRIGRVMYDNAMAYRRSHAWRTAMADLGAQPRFTRSSQPQTNGEAERFNRTLADEWAYVRPFRQLSRTSSGLARLAAHHHRSHTPLGRTPANQPHHPQRPCRASQLGDC